MDPADEIYEGPVLPPVRQPKGARYYLGTWSGRLIIANSIVMVAMILLDRSFLLPSLEVLDTVGAKDPVALAQGQWWRFATPIFVHIGLIHFLFNTMGLYYIGYQLERVLGAGWFLAIYLLAGIAGNISSSVFTVAMSAGASGALFGLLGAGYFLERTIGDHIESLTGRRPRQRVYSGMVFINVLLGLIIPGIDNAAHIGGLVVGVGLTLIMVNVRPNRLQSVNKARAWVTGCLLVAVAAAGAYLGTNKNFVVSRLEAAAEKAAVDRKDLAQTYHYYSEVLEINPFHTGVLIKRARILLMNGDETAGLEDVRRALAALVPEREVRRLIEDLQAAGYFDTAREIEILLAQSPVQNL